MNTTASKVTVPAEGEAIRVAPDGSLLVPDCPIIAFIEGDGIGVDITPVMRQVVDSAVQRAYQGQADRLDGGLRRREGHEGLWSE